MKYRVTHITQYQYSESVSRCHNEARLTPFNNESQTCFVSRIVVSPKPALIFDRFDYFGNTVSSFEIHRQHETLTVKVESEVETIEQNVPASLAQMKCAEVAERLLSDNDPNVIKAREYSLPSPMIPSLHEAYHYAKELFKPENSALEAVSNLMATIYKDFTYEPGVTSVATPLSEVLAHRQGVCQDFAHLGIACLRSMGFAAKYVSGYLETRPPPGKKKLVGADASHAWFSVYFPDYGWLAFDPTNNQCPNQQYVIVGQGRDFADVTPLKGIVYGGGKHQLNVSVDVAPLIKEKTSSNKRQ